MVKLLLFKKYVRFVAIIMLASMIGEWNAQAMEDEAIERSSHRLKIQKVTTKILNTKEVRENFLEIQNKPFLQIETLAEKGTAQDKYNMGLAYLRLAPPDLARALFLFEQSGTDEGAYNAGRIHEANGDLDQAQKWYKWAAVHGHTPSLVICGNKAYEKKNYPLALFETAGEKGLLDAQFKAGFISLKMSHSANDLSVKKAYAEKAYVLFTKAFNYGLPEEDRQQALNLFERIYFKHINNKRYDLASIYTEPASKLRNIPAKKRFNL